MNRSLKAIERKIEQRDSISSLSFVLCKISFYSKLTLFILKKNVKIRKKYYNTNHLFLLLILNFYRFRRKFQLTNGETKKIYLNVGLEVNWKKSVSNCKGCENYTVVLKGYHKFKCLGTPSCIYKSK